MLHNVLLKTWHDQRRGLTAWAIGIVALVGMYVGLWPSVSNQPALTEFMDSMPDALRAMLAMSGADMTTPIGYVKIEMLSLMAPLLLIIYAVLAGADAVAGEEEKHTLDLLLSTPVTRRSVLLQKLGAMVGGVALLVTVTAGALLVLGPIASMTLPAGAVVATMVHLGALAVVFGAMAAAVGAWTGSVALSRALPAVGAVVTYVLNGLGPQVSWLQPWYRVSPFYQFTGHDPLVTGLSAPSLLVALGTAAALAVVAVVGFRRRDVTA